MAKRYYDSMIKEDRSKLCNLPQEVIMKEYAKTPYHNEASLNDTISGIDNQIRSDVKAGDIKTGSMPEKY